MNEEKKKSFFVHPDYIEEFNSLDLDEKREVFLSIFFRLDFKSVREWLEEKHVRVGRL